MARVCSIEGCDQTHFARTLCHYHYNKAYTHGTLPPKVERPYEEVIRERFWSRVDKTETCWNWTGAKNDVGYGQMRFNNKCHYVHRMSFEYEYGPIPAGMLVDHKCFNPVCVNPHHLRLASKKQNAENLRGPISTNTSGVLGVSWCKQTQSWRSAVRHNGKTHWAGRHANIADAEAAVVELRNRLFTHNLMDRT